MYSKGQIKKTKKKKKKKKENNSRCIVPMCRRRSARMNNRVREKINIYANVTATNRATLLNRMIGLLRYFFFFFILIHECTCFSRTRWEKVVAGFTVIRGIPKEEERTHRAGIRHS